MILGQLNDIDIKLLRVFRRIVECGGMSAAELELNVSGSVISRQLKDLEIRLGGLKLCNRGRGGFSLTEDGKQVYDAILRLHASIDRFRSDITDIHQIISGNLIVAIGDLTISNPDARIAQAFQLFNQIAPEVTLELHAKPLSEIEPLVIDGTYHIGIVPSHRESGSLNYEPLFTEEMCLYCGALHPLSYADHAIIGWSNIREYAYVGLGYHSPNQELSQKVGLKRMATAYEQESIATLVASNRYLGFLPEHYAAQFAESGRMRKIDNDLFKYNVQYTVITRKTPVPSRLVSILLQCLLRAHDLNPDAQVPDPRSDICNVTAG